MSEDWCKDQYRGFTIVCERCDGEEAYIDSTLGFSVESGAWGCIKIICGACGNEVVIIEP